MIITCEECSTRFVLDDALIKPEGSKVRCGKCRHVFTAFPVGIPEKSPAVEIPGPPESGEPDLSFDELDIPDDSDFDVSQDEDFSIDSDSDVQDSDLEDTDLDFPEIEFDEPEFAQDTPAPLPDSESPDFQEQEIEIEDPDQDFDEDGLDFEADDFELDEPEPDFQDSGLSMETQDFEFEEIPPALTSASADSDADTADIEISFDADQGGGLELEELSFDVGQADMDNVDVVQESSGGDFELDIKEDTPEFEDDPQAELIIEEQPEDPGVDEEGDEAIEQAVSEQDKFAEYDKVLEQETEPGDAAITIPDPEVEDDTYSSETQSSPSGEKTQTGTEGLIDQQPLGTPLTAQSVRQKRGAKKKKGLSLPVKILLVLFLLVMAAYVAITRLGVTVPMVSDIQIPFVTQWLQPKQLPPPPLELVPDEPSIDGRFVSNKSAGDLFIVTGKVKNPSNIAVSFIRVKGTLMTKDNMKAGSMTAYCGNVIPEEVLESGNISDITKQMGVREGNQSTNVNIKPGASVMFMLVFSNLPEDLSNFTVAVQDFEPAGE